MKFFSSSLDFCYSWRDVAVGLFQRYPNPFSKHVLTEDVLERYVDKDGKLHSIKMVTKTNPMPRWGERLYSGPKYVVIIEESIVDPSTQTFTTYSRNISMVNWLSTVEKCTYKSIDGKPQATQIEKQAWFDSGIGYGLSRPILEFSLSRYKNNQQKATRGLEYAVTHILPLTLKERVRQKTEQFAESAKISKGKITEGAKQKKEVLSQKAKHASELAKAKAEKAKSKAAELPKVKAAEEY